MLVLGVMARAGRELPIAHLAQRPADGALLHRDAEHPVKFLRQVAAPPAHDAVDRRDRAALDHLGECPTVFRSQFRRRTGTPAVLQPLRAVRVEPQDPGADDLQRDAADLRRIRPPAAVTDHRKRQQPTGLVAVAAPARQAPEIVAIIVVTKINRSAHQRLLFAQEALTQNCNPLGIPRVSQGPRLLV